MKNNKVIKYGLVSVVALYALYVIVGNIVYRNISISEANVMEARVAELAQNTNQQPNPNPNQQPTPQRPNPNQRPTPNQRPSLWERLFGRCRVQLGTGQQTQDDVYRRYQNGMYDGRRAQQESDQATNSNDKGVCLGWRWEW